MQTDVDTVAPDVSTSDLDDFSISGISFQRRVINLWGHSGAHQRAEFTSVKVRK